MSHSVTAAELLNEIPSTLTRIGTLSYQVTCRYPKRNRSGIKEKKTKIDVAFVLLLLNKYTKLALTCLGASFPKLR